MVSRVASLVFACVVASCGPGATQHSETTKLVSSAPSNSPNEGERSEVSQWSEVPQNEPANAPAVIGKRKAQLIIVSNPSSHGDSLHFRFEVNSVSISGVFSAPGGQISTFTLPTGSVRATIDECNSDPIYFDLAVDERVSLDCELTTEGDCCEPTSSADQKR